MGAPRGAWVKSSKSGPNCDNCVEVFVDGQVAVRDTKDRQGPQLVFAADSFRAFVGAARAGTLRPA